MDNVELRKIIKQILTKMVPLCMQFWVRGVMGVKREKGVHPNEGEEGKRVNTY